MEKTLVLLKPDTIRKGICGEALQRLKRQATKYWAAK